MQIDISVYRIERFPTDDMTFADLITSGATRTGSASYVSHPTNPEAQLLDIPFSPEPTAAEQWAITRRLITVDADEEQLYINAEQAIDSNNNWRTNTSPQVTTGADTIINDTSISSAEVQTYLRDLARGVRTLNVQTAALSNQNNNIIQLLLKLLNQ